MNRKGGSRRRTPRLKNHSLCICPLYDLTESRDQGLCQPEAENQLGSSHQKLGGQSLEQTHGTLVLEHVGHNSEARLGVLEVAVLDTGLDNIQRSGDDQRSTGTGNGGNKVLTPGGLVVVGQTVNVFLGEGRSTEKLA